MRREILGTFLGTALALSQNCGGRQEAPQEIPPGKNLVEVDTVNFPPNSTAHFPCTQLNVENLGDGSRTYHIYIAGAKTVNPGQDTFSVEILEEPEKIPPYTGLTDDYANLRIKDMTNCAGKENNQPVAISSAILKNDPK